MSRIETDSAGGEQSITLNNVTISVGMDAFIWRRKPPHKRAAVAFKDQPYTKDEWLAVFPDANRRLLDGCSFPSGEQDSGQVLPTKR